MFNKLLTVTGLDCCLCKKESIVYCNLCNRTYCEKCRVEKHSPEECRAVSENEKEDDTDA